MIRITLLTKKVLTWFGQKCQESTVLHKLGWTTTKDGEWRVSMQERLELGGMQSPSALQLWGVFQVGYLTNGDGGGMLGGLQAHHIQLAGHYLNGCGPQACWVILLTTRVGSTI